MRPSYFVQWNRLLPSRPQSDSPANASAINSSRTAAERRGRPLTDIRRWKSLRLRDISYCEPAINIEKSQLLTPVQVFVRNNDATSEKSWLNGKRMFAIPYQTWFLYFGFLPFPRRHFENVTEKGLETQHLTTARHAFNNILSSNPTQQLVNIVTAKSVTEIICQD